MRLPAETQTQHENLTGYALQLGRARIWLGKTAHSRAGCLANARIFASPEDAESARQPLAHTGTPWRVVEVNGGAQ